MRLEKRNQPSSPKSPVFGPFWEMSHILTPVAILLAWKCSPDSLPWRLLISDSEAPAGICMMAIEIVKVRCYTLCGDMEIHGVVWDIGG